MGSPDSTGADEGRDSDDQADLPPLTVLAASLREQIPRLVQGEAALLKAEIGERRSRITTGSGMLVGTVLVGFFGLAALIAAAVVSVSLALAPWLAALIILVVLVILAGIFVLLGIRKLKGNNVAGN
jgi:uncharacterized membrane protein YqjE